MRSGRFSGPMSSSDTPNTTWMRPSTSIRALGAPVPERLLELQLDPLDSDTATAEFEKIRAA